MAALVLFDEPPVAEDPVPDPVAVAVLGEGVAPPAAGAPELTDPGQVFVIVIVSLVLIVN
jgi:hypothetical protein